MDYVAGHDNLLVARQDSPEGGRIEKRKSKRAGVVRDFDALYERRMRAVDMFEAGKRQVDVAVELEVPAQTVCKWHGAWMAGGRDALVGAGRAGRPRRLDDEQLALVEAALVRGPRANRFATELWTLARVTEVIERESGVRYSQTQTWAILRERLGWSRQRPARRTVERDDDAVKAWREQEWPRIKKSLGTEARGSASRTKADSPCSRQ